MAAYIQTIFGNLRPDSFAVKSPQTWDYNCIAWAAGEVFRRWWPSPDRLSYYWPPNVARVETVDAFVRAFQELGYEVCDSSDLQEGYEKVALYATATGVPKHMARQRETGIWTSKLGRLEDIDHVFLEGVEGNDYGQVARVLKRRRPVELAGHLSD